MKGSGVRLIRALVIHLRERERKSLETCTRSILSVILFSCFFFFIFLIVAQFALLSKYRALCSGCRMGAAPPHDRNRWQNLITGLQALIHPLPLILSAFCTSIHSSINFSSSPEHMPGPCVSCMHSFLVTSDARSLVFLDSFLLLILLHHPLPLYSFISSSHPSWLSFLSSLVLQSFNKNFPLLLIHLKKRSRVSQRLRELVAVDLARALIRNQR